MFQRFGGRRAKWPRNSCFSEMRRRAKWGILLWSAAAGLVGEAQDNFAPRQNDFSPATPFHFVTNVAQFRALSGKDYLDECVFHLTAVVTDTILEPRCP